MTPLTKSSANPDLLELRAADAVRGTQARIKRMKPPKIRIAWYRTGEMLQFGGGERVLLEGLKCFDDMGADARLVLHEPASTETGTYFAKRHPKIQILPGFSLRDSNAGRAMHAPARIAGRVRSLRRTIAAIAPDFIIAESPVEARFLWLYTLGGRLSLPPVMTFIHGSPFQFDNDVTKYARVFRDQFNGIRDADPVYRETIPPAPPPMSAASRLRLELECTALRAGVRMSRRVFVLSEKNRDEVKRLYGVDSVVASPGGFGCGDIRFNEKGRVPGPLGDARRPVLLSVCRLIAKKRIDLLVRAFRAFLDQDPRSPATLVIGGEGVEKRALKQLASELGLEGRVRFTGFIPEAELAAWYRGSDVFLNADNADYDLSVMMALPAGRKVVVSTQYDIPAGLSSLRRFFFVAPPTADGYAKTIAAALGQSVAPLAEADRPELDALCWESYFATILDHSRRAIAAPGATKAPA